MLEVGTLEEVVVLLPEVLAGELCVERPLVLTELVLGLLLRVFTLCVARLVVVLLVAGFTALAPLE